MKLAMNLAELQHRVSQYADLDLAPLYEAYRAQGGNGDIEGFLAFLSSSRIIDTTLLRELHSLGDVEVPGATDPALQEPQLAAWASAAPVAPDRGPATAAPSSPPSPSPAPGAPSPAPAAPTTEVRYQPIALLGQGAMGAIRI